MDFDVTVNGSIEPVGDDVLVYNIETEGERVVNGIILLDERGSDRGIRNRWACVYAVGPDQKDIKVGDWIYIEHGRWTRGVLVKDGDQENVVRKVDVEAILGVGTPEMAGAA